MPVTAPRVNLTGCVSCSKKLLAAMQGKGRMKPVIFIIMDTKPGTSTTEITLAEKLQLARRVYESCFTEGMEIVIVASGPRAGVEAVRSVIPNVPLHGVGKDFDPSMPAEFDRQLGECSMGLRVLAEAQAMKADWIIKVAADTFHPAPGWAQKMIDEGVSHGAELVSCPHHRPDWVTTQVYAVRPAFMRATYPPMTADYGRIGIEAQWGERIAAAGLTAAWYQPPGREITTDGTCNVIPTDPAIAYVHAHCLATAAAWQPVDMRVKPDLGLKISIVIPARNENGVNPMRGNVPLLTDTFNSIRETSPADNLPECVLIDDGSAEALPPHGYPGEITVVKHPHAWGVDAARNHGIQCARGKVIGILDGHMRVENIKREPIMFGLQKLATVAMQKQGFAHGRTIHLEQNTEGFMTGGGFMPLTVPASQLALGWQSYNPPDCMRRTTAMLGAQYFAPADIWRRIGGFVNSCTTWGYSEEGIGLKAAFCGIPTWYVGEVSLSHWFRQKAAPFPVDDSNSMLNRARVLRVAFSIKCFRDFWTPRLKLSTGVGLWQPHWDAALAAPELLAEYEAFQKIRTRTDADVLRDVFQAEYAG